MDRTSAAENLKDVARHAAAYNIARERLELYDSVCGAAGRLVNRPSRLTFAIRFALSGRDHAPMAQVPSLLAYWMRAAT
jgi:hypothetical protein